MRMIASQRGTDFLRIFTPVIRSASGARMYAISAAPAKGITTARKAISTTRTNSHNPPRIHRRRRAIASIPSFDIRPRLSRGPRRPEQRLRPLQQQRQVLALHAVLRRLGERGDLLVQPAAEEQQRALALRRQPALHPPPVPHVVVVRLQVVLQLPVGEPERLFIDAVVRAR